MKSRRSAGDVAVIGLGRFGSQIAEALAHLNQQVLAIDADPERVQRWSERLTQVVQADGTSETALRQLGLPDFHRVVVAIGGTLEASVLTVLALNEVGVRDIWARATSRKHAKILYATGAQHVIFPEAEMGERVAHLIVSKLLDFVEFGENFALAKTPAPSGLIGRRLADIDIRERFGVLVVGVRTSDNRYEYARPDVVIKPDSTLIVEGSIEQVQRFSAMS
ncbi:potassium channel family protein [Micromonospora sp. RTP1Z1]|uniref:potassium channel family protein n=1 Tax=Micromonospora sp. RTP1Z1 TaxID=2994043 RepID=UPI0039B3A610